MSEAENRRAYFRIDDEVFLSVNKVEQADNVEPIDTHMYFDSFRQSTIVSSRFNQQRISMAPVLEQIRARDVAVASYLSMLSDQMDLIANKLQSGSVFGTGEQLQKVDLSAEGMSFCSVDQYQKGDRLEIIFALFPEGDYIPVLADVVRAEPVGETSDYKVSVKFSSINDDDKELVIHHMLYLQRQLLQKKRLA